MAIALSKQYVPLLDEVYQNASKTQDLNVNSRLIKKGANPKEVLFPVMEMDGLADYSRSSGYTKRNVTLTYETKTFNYDRGAKFEVDTMDNQETEEVAFGMLGSEFIRKYVVPEADAYTFASLAGATGISKVATGATLATGSAVMAALKVGLDQMDEDQVPEEGRILYITPGNLSSIKAMATTESRELLESFAKIVKVPQARFYTGINLLDGTSEDEEAGNYEKATGAKDINFMIIEPSAVIKTDKHTASNIITPEENQNSDGWIQKYRKYGIVDVFNSKASGIYLHHKA